MDFEEGMENTLALQRNLQKFIDQVEELRNEDDPSGDGFTREFRSIRELGIRMKEENTYPAEEGKKPCNIKKNRYRDILPFDETRVTLEKIPGEEGSDYINANFIMNHNEAIAYIASQGPLPHTVNDFWRMIMQYDVKVIVMACQTVEMGRKKCEPYWPDEDADNKTQEFGDVTVTMELEQVTAEDCMKRVLKARQGDKTQTVTQFHYTYWPDHDIPKDFATILEMMAEMRQIRAEDPDKSPILVHCSAGCGRTGTICAIDYSWEVLHSGYLTEDFSLYEIVKKMREQRQSMIQAPEQYMMAHVIIEQLFEKHLEMMQDHIYGNVEAPEEDVSSISSDKSSSRKNSLLEHDIGMTLKKVTGDDSSLDSKSLTQDHNIPPYSPIPEEPIKSPGVKQIAAVFSVDKIDNVPPPKQTLKSQTSITTEGKKKHVTTISIGGGTPKQSMSRTVSQPAKPTSNSTPTNPINSNRARSLPPVTSANEKPQSSIPPTLPTQPKGGVYSYAGKVETTTPTDSSYSTTTNYSSIPPTLPTQPKGGVYSYAGKVETTTPTDSSYSTLTNYSSVTQNNSSSSAPPHSYHVLEKPGNHEAGSGGLYSMANDPSSLYSPVVKKVNGVSKLNGTSSDVYEVVDVRDKPREPPRLPDRGYLEDEPANQREKPPLGGPGDTLGRTKQFMSNFKNMFSIKPQTGSEPILPKDVPGYKQKIGSKPNGPRESPWKQK